MDFVHILSNRFTGRVNMISERMDRPVLRQFQWVTNLTNGEQVSIFQDLVYFNIIVRHFLHNRIETKNTDIKTVRGTEIEHQDLSYLTTGLRSLHKVLHVYQPLFFPPFKCQLTFPARADHNLYTESHPLNKQTWFGGPQSYFRENASDGKLPSHLQLPGREISNDLELHLTSQWSDLTLFTQRHRY